MKSNYKLIILLAAALMCGITACHKDAQIEPKSPKVTKPNVSFTGTTANFSWEVSFPGKVSSVVKLSQHADMSEATAYGNDTPTSNKDFYVEITGLSPETKYYYRFETWNPNLDFRNEVKSFTTLTVSKPSVTTYIPTSISWTTATAGGNVIDDGNDVVTERGVCWGTNHNPDMSSGFSHIASTSAGTGEYTCSITGLAPSTKYYVRAYATNSKGTNYGEEKEFTTFALQKPTVATAPVSQFNFTNATAVGGGEVISDGGDAVTERGIYFGTNPNPATTGTKIAASSAGTGNFTCTMTGLVEETTYYVCAYATNGQGTSYGSEKSFSYDRVPIGAIKGVFSVSSSKKVYFSQGNLQYRASDGKWRFAEHQYDYIGSSNSGISSTYNNYIDLFGWGTSGWNSGAVCYQPWCTSTSDSDYYPGGSHTNNLTGSYANADWGVYNKIYNGGNTAGQWRTLTKDEWVYVFQSRSNASSKYGHGKVNGVCGMILLPDSWTLPSGLSFTAGNSSWANSYTTDQWAMMEANGAVFLPAAGSRSGTSVDYVGSYGFYWSASRDNSSNACRVSFYSGGLYPSDYGRRYYGRSVRLVAPAE